MESLGWGRFIVDEFGGIILGGGRVDFVLDGFRIVVVLRLVFGIFLGIRIDVGLVSFVY